MTGYDKEQFRQIMVQEETKSELDHIIDIVKKARKEGAPRHVEIEGEDVRLKASYDGVINLLVWNMMAMGRVIGFSGTYEQLVMFGLRDQLTVGAEEARHHNGNGHGSVLLVTQ